MCVCLSAAECQACAELLFHTSAELAQVSKKVISKQTNKQKPKQVKRGGADRRWLSAEKESHD